MKLFDTSQVSIYKPRTSKVVLIDGSNMFYRACLAQFKGKESDLNVTVSNFFKMFKKSIKDYPKYVAIVFDSGQKNFRHQLSAEYKSNRKTHIAEKELKLSVIQHILQYYGFAVLDSGRYEADDVIGSLAFYLRSEHFVEIHSEDKDFLQCVRRNVVLHKGGLIYDSEKCFQKYGVTPKQFVDYLALIGDTSDCVKGASKWGKKTASKYLSMCGNIEQICEEKLTKSLQSIHTFDVELTRKLVRIKTNIKCIKNVNELSVAEKNSKLLSSLSARWSLFIGDLY